MNDLFEKLKETIERYKNQNNKNELSHDDVRQLESDFVNKISDYINDSLRSISNQLGEKKETFFTAIKNSVKSFFNENEFFNSINKNENEFLNTITSKVNSFIRTCQDNAKSVGDFFRNLNKDDVHDKNVIGDFFSSISKRFDEIVNNAKEAIGMNDNELSTYLKGALVVGSLFGAGIGGYLIYNNINNTKKEIEETKEKLKNELNPEKKSLLKNKLANLSVKYAIMKNNTKR